MASKIRHAPLRKQCINFTGRHKMIVAGRYKVGYYFMDCIICEGRKVWRFWR